MVNDAINSVVEVVEMLYLRNIGNIERNGVEVNCSILATVFHDHEVDGAVAHCAVGFLDDWRAEEVAGAPGGVGGREGGVAHNCYDDWISLRLGDKRRFLTRCCRTRMWVSKEGEERSRCKANAIHTREFGYVFLTALRAASRSRYPEKHCGLE